MGIFFFKSIYPIPQTRDWVQIPCTIVVQACLVIELLAIELIRQVFGATVLINQQLTVWQIGIILGDVGFIICDVRRAAEVVTVIEEGFLFRCVVWDIAITSLRVIRVGWVVPAYRWTRVDDGAAVALVKSYLWAVVASYPRNEWFALFKQGEPF